MTAKPRDDMAAAAAGRGRLRASHADREHVLDVLKAAFVEGRLTEDEFDMRVGQTFASRTYAELAALTADIPAGLIGVQLLRKPARAEAPHPQNKVVNSCACAALAVLALGAALVTGYVGLSFVSVVAILGILFVVGGRMAHSSHAPPGTYGRGRQLARAVKAARLTASAVSAEEPPTDQYGIVPAPPFQIQTQRRAWRRIRRLRLRAGPPPTIRSSHC